MYTRLLDTMASTSVESSNRATPTDRSRRFARINRSPDIVQVLIATRYTHSPKQCVTIDRIADLLSHADASVGCVLANRTLDRRATCKCRHVWVTLVALMPFPAQFGISIERTRFRRFVSGIVQARYATPSHFRAIENNVKRSRRADTLRIPVRAFRFSSLNSDLSRVATGVCRKCHARKRQIWLCCRVSVPIFAFAFALRCSTLRHNLQYTFSLFSQI